MGNSKRILIVEDMPDWQKKLKDILEREGYEIRIASGYGEALGELCRQSFDLAIIDLRLNPVAETDRSGIALVEDASDRGTPTIVVTAYGIPELADEAIEKYGAFSFIDKPSFNLTRFIELVKEAIESKPKLRPSLLQERRTALLQKIKDLYGRAHLVSDERERRYFEWLEAIGKGRISTEVEASRKRRERDLKEIDGWYKQLRGRIDQAKNLQELDTIEMELIREGENWVASFSEFETS